MWLVIPTLFKGRSITKDRIVSPVLGNQISLTVEFFDAIRRQNRRQRGLGVQLAQQVAQVEVLTGVD